MGKAARLKRQRNARMEREREKGMIVPLDPKDVCDGFSYWVTGYFWMHDLILVEPFCVVRSFGEWKVTNLATDDIDYHNAQRLIGGDGTMMFFEDRVQALRACEAIEQQNILLSSMAEYMSPEEIKEAINVKGG